MRPCLLLGRRLGLPGFVCLASGPGPTRTPCAPSRCRRSRRRVASSERDAVVVGRGEHVRQRRSPSTPGTCLDGDQSARRRRRSAPGCAAGAPGRGSTPRACTCRRSGRARRGPARSSGWRGRWLSRSTPPRARSTVIRRLRAGELDVVEGQGLPREQRLDDFAHALDDAHLTVTSSGRVPPTTKGVGRSPRLTGSSRL